MKAVLAGAFGKLGSDILKVLVDREHEVVAADIAEHEIEGLEKGSYTFRKIDATDPATLAGICDGADAVITTIGLTTASAKVTAYDIDYHGNLNLLNEAKRAGVGKFVYISVIKADKAPDTVPMVHAKALMEADLKASGIPYVIHRPTGYFYDIVKVFKPMVESGSVSLLGKEPVHANVVDCPEFAEFIVDHIGDENVTYSVGGKETWSYEEIARMCFDAAGKEPVIKYAPAFLFDVLAWLPKNKKNGKSAIIRFSKWTLTEEMVGDTHVGEHSFRDYIYQSFKKEA